MKASAGCLLRRTRARLSSVLRAGIYLPVPGPRLARVREACVGRQLSTPSYRGRLLRGRIDERFGKEADRRGSRIVEPRGADSGAFEGQAGGGDSRCRARPGEDAATARPDPDAGATRPCKTQ